jgi:hypothetical protein
MKPILLLLLLLTVGCHSSTGSDHLSSQNNNRTSTSQNSELEVKTLIGKVPTIDFAMPRIGNCGVQGSFVDEDTEEGIIAVYPKGMDRPNRNVSIQVSGQIQTITLSPPSSRKAKPSRTYNQKVIIVDSWQYIK